MIIFGIISEFLLYTCFALLMGDYLLAMVATHRKPEVSVPKSARILAVTGIVLFSFAPIVDLVSHLKAGYGVGGALETILLTFTVGQAWTITFLLSIILGMFILVVDGLEGKRYPWAGMGLISGLILCMGWAGHSASMYSFPGFITHVLHFMAVTVWIGVLFVTSYFTVRTVNWDRFLQWFHVTAIVCFLITVGTGLLMMEFIVSLEAYTNAWALPYGQSLLLKHLLILPLLLYALLNGVFVKRKWNSGEEFDPKPWTRVEFAVVGLIFAATGAMGQQAPPHNNDILIGGEGVSWLFTLFHGELGGPVTSIGLSFDIVALLFGLIAVLFLGVGFLSFLKKVPPFFSFLMSVLFLISAYSSLMLSVEIH